MRRMERSKPKFLAKLAALALVLALGLQALPPAYAGEGENPPGQEQAGEEPGGQDARTNMTPSEPGAEDETNLNALEKGNGAEENTEEATENETETEDGEEEAAADGPLMNPAFSPFQPMAAEITTSIDNFYTNLAQVITDTLAAPGDTTATLTLQGLGTTAQLPDPSGFFPLPAITEDLTVVLRSASPVTLYSHDNADARHLEFEVAGGKTLTLALDNVTLSGKDISGGVKVTTPGASADFVFKGGIIEHCKTTGIGGAIQAGSGSSSSLVHVQILAGTLRNNTANNSGGGVYGDGGVRVGGSARISGNTANNSGGGVNGGNGLVAVGGNARISGNTAVSGGGGSGGRNITIGGSAEISGNTARYNGGGVHGSGNSVFITLEDNAQITGNTAGNLGGGISAFASGNLTMATTVVFGGNQALSGGYDATLSNNAWASIPCTEPFTHVENNYDVNYWGSGQQITGTPRHFVIFDLNDGLGTVHDWAEITNPGNNPLSAFPGDPALSGYTFQKWTENADGTGAVIDETTSFADTASHRVYAQWTADSGGGNNGNNNNTNSGGYSSGGSWDDSDRDNSNPHAGRVLAERVFRVDLQLNGGSLKGDTVLRVKEGDTLDQPHDPVREGYVLTGWYTDKGCTQAYNFNRSVSGSFSLYAGWEAVPEPEPAAWRNPFTDVRQSDWFYGDIAYVYEKGLMVGLTPTEFYPHQPVTRGMFVTILHRMRGDTGAIGGSNF